MPTIIPSSHCTSFTPHFIVDCRSFGQTKNSSGNDFNSKTIWGHYSGIKEYMEHSKVTCHFEEPDLTIEEYREVLN